MKIDLSTAEVSNVFTNMGRTDASTNPRLSPDGRYLYYKRLADFDKVGYEGMRVHRFDLRTGADQEIYRAPAGGMVRLFALSRDGSQLAIGGRQAAGKDRPDEERSDWIVVAPASGGEGRTVLRHPGDTGMRGYNGIAWTADGKSILYHTVVRGTNRDILWLLPLDGAPARKLFETGTIWNIAVHPNGQDYILDSRSYKQELWVMEGVK